MAATSIFKASNEKARFRTPAVTLKSPTCGRVKIPQGWQQERVDC